MFAGCGEVEISTERHEERRAGAVGRKSRSLADFVRS